MAARRRRRRGLESWAGAEQAWRAALHSASFVASFTWKRNPLEASVGGLSLEKRVISYFYYSVVNVCKVCTHRGKPGRFAV